MKREIVGLAVLLAAWTLSAAQTFVLHGLTNTTIGNAIYGTNYYADVVYHLSTNGTDGVSIGLGEADSGLFIYPTTEGDPAPGTFMSGDVYGSVDGETNRLICRMRASEVTDGVHPVEIDFSPLGATNFTYIAYDRGRIVGTSTGQPGTLDVGGDWFNPLWPRVNPFWRFPDGTVGAMIEFLDFAGYTYYEPDRASMSVPGIDNSRIERLFIRPEGVTNIVNFASRVDIFAGGGLPWFQIYDARLGMFGRGHKALPETLHHAQAGHLTLVGTNDTPAVAIELRRAGRFEATFAPIEFATNTAFALAAIGRGSTNSGDSLGEARITPATNALNLSAHLDVGADTNMQVAVYRAGAEIARVPGTNASVPPATRLLGAGLQARATATLTHLAFRFEQTVPVLLPDQTSVDGDELRFIAGNDAKFVFLETMVLQATNLPSFTITAETEQPAEEPTLQIRGADDGQAELFWRDPNRAYQVEFSYSVTGPFYPISSAYYPMGSEAIYDGDTVRVLLEVYYDTTVFYRLTTDPRRVPPPDW